MNWFECKVSYERQTENGLKNVNELYLVDAISFAEAEARIVEELTPYMSGEFSITSVRKKKISDIVAVSGDKWYDCRVCFIIADEATGAEKKMKQSVYVQGNNLENALEGLKESLKGIVSDHEIMSIAETQIIDIFVYAVNK
jgi:hypothetical protein